MTNPPFHLDDPRLTAFALGELDPADAAILQRQLDSDPALRTQLARIRSSVSALSAHFAAEPALHLTAQQRAAVTAPSQAAAVAPVIVRPLLWTSRLWLASGLAAAACLGIASIMASRHNADQSTGGRNFALTNPAVPGKNPHFESFDLNQSAADAQAREKLAPDSPKDSIGPSPITASASQPAPALGELSAAFEQSLRDQSAVALPSPVQADALRADFAKKLSDPAEGQSANQPAPTQADAAYRFGAELAPADRAASPSSPPPGDAAPGAPMPASGGVDISDRDGWSGGAVAAGGGNMAGARAEESQVRSFTVAPAIGGRSSQNGFVLHSDSGDVHDSRRSARRAPAPTGESYNLITDNPFIKPDGLSALSTFGFEVDTASYSNIRRFLLANQLPPADAVRIEELVNYFTYAYPAPPSSSPHPLAINVELAPAPWAPAHKLLRVGIKAREIDPQLRPSTSLVFLIDVSGSMDAPDKLPLLKESLKLLVNRLTADDRLAIVTYSSNAAIALPSTFLNQKSLVIDLIDSLHAGGSTAGAQGIQIAYDVARDAFLPNGVNRVILCTDGDFNVGISDQSELIRFIEEKRKSGVFLSVLGFGTGNLQDSKMEQLADHGNGAYGYIDSISEARRIFVNNLSGSLVTVAKDVKAQVEFNPGKVAAYRQIGYENRALAPQDFNDPAKDAGEIGAGQSVTALYEIVPLGVDINLANVDDLKYQKPATPQQPDIRDGVEIVPSNELCTVKVRYKLPDAPNHLLALNAPQDRSAGTALDVPDAAELRTKSIPPSADNLPQESRSASTAPAHQPQSGLVAAEAAQGAGADRADAQSPSAPPTIVHILTDESLTTLDKSSADFRFAASVASFGMLLRESPYKGAASFVAALELAQSALGEDPDGYRAQFLDLLDRARRLKGH